MKISFKKSIMFMMILLALTVSALGVTPALADDGVTPPTDAPAVEEPVADAPVTEESVADAPAAEEPVADAPAVDAPAAEEPAADAPAAEPTVEEMTVTEILEQLPEDTGLVVLDENGEALPLASQEASQTLSSSTDPFFWDGTQYVGFSESGVCLPEVTVCNKSATPLQDAIDAFGTSSTASGNIYVAAGTYDVNVTISGKNGNFANLSGLIGEGSDSTTLNGNVSVYGINTNVFTFQGFTLNGSFIAGSNTGTLNITDIAQDGGSTSNYGTGIQVYGQKGDVNLTDVSAKSNSFAGIELFDIRGDVTVTGGEFSGNMYGIMNDGIYYSDTNTFTINGAYIHDNHVGIGGHFFMPFENSFVVNCSTFSDNGRDIDYYYYDIQVNEGGCGAAGQPYVSWPFGAVQHSAGIFEQEPADDVKYASPYIVIEQTQEQLPAALGEGFKFGSALKVELTNEGKDVTDLAITLSFPIPADMKDASLVVMFWNGSAWVEVSGGSVVNGFYVITVTQPGDYVLVAK